MTLIARVFFIDCVISLWYHSGMGEISFNLRMSKELKERLETEARKKNRSLNNLIVTVLEAYASIEVEETPTEIKGVVEKHYIMTKPLP